LTLPGFIDLQVNGYAGINFHSPATTVDDILNITETLTNEGTIGFLPTITTGPREEIEHCINTIAKAINKQGKYGHILGIHLEGPFISPEYGYRGAHPELSITPPDLNWFNKLQKISEDSIRILTLSPEIDNAAEFIKAISKDIIVSVGHSNCTYENIKVAVSNGLSLATHIGNGCKQLIDRHNNPIINILACNQITLCFIADGHHLPEAFIRVLINSRPIKKLIVVSDSVKFAGMKPGKYISARNVEIMLDENGRLYLLSDPDVMAGSSSNMIKCMNHLSSIGFLSEEDMWNLGYFNPLRLLEIDPKYFLNFSCKVSFDKQINKFLIAK
jgi:N-acetylglucosamine-6-phosphate deacetylase